MEKKLAEYRANREKNEKLQRYKVKLKELFSFLSPKKKSNSEENKDSQEIRRQSVPINSLKKRKMEMVEEKRDLIPPDDVSLDEESLMDDTLQCCSWLQFIYYFLCFILWGSLYLIFIKLEFGTVFLILSALIFMYLNTGTRPKRSDEVSAYSVFNKDCVSIDGTLKAEQFEREIMFGPGSVR